VQRSGLCLRKLGNAKGEIATDSTKQRPKDPAPQLLQLRVPSDASLPALGGYASVIWRLATQHLKEAPVTPGSSLQEYKTICEFMRLYATLRFYQLALLLGTSGAIVTALLTSATIHALPKSGTILKLAGLAVAVALTVEFRATSYWHRMRDRANVLCETLGYQGFAVSSRWNPLTTSGAGFYLHVIITLLWFATLFIRVAPPA
jgi:hypothetical protein